MDDSAREMFARLVRHYRRAAGSKSECARVIGYSASYLSRIESGERVPRADVVRDLDEGLGAGGALIELARVLHDRHRETASLDTAPVDELDSVEAGEVERRQLLQHAIGLSGAVGLAGAFGQLDAVQATLDDALDRSVEEWEEVAWEYGRDILTVPPADVLDGLSADVLAVRCLLDRPASGGDRASLQRVAAQLSVITAMTLANLGQTVRARKWWRTARTAADRSGDTRTGTWVRGRQTIRGLSEGRDAEDVVDMAQSILARAPSEVGAGTMEALGARAQGLARLGSPQAASAVNDVSDAFDELPDAVLVDRSVYGWSERRLHFWRSYVYTHTGDVRAVEAQDTALSLYPAGVYADPAKVELHRARWLVRIGDPAEGLRHAVRTIAALPRQFRTQSVMVTACDVERALPTGAEAIPEAAEYRELLAGSAPAPST